MNAGARILIVEDEGLIAMLLEDMLEDLGYKVAGTAPNLATALQMVETTAIDAAVLDVSLHGEKSYPAADALERKGIPYIFASGYGAGGIDAPYAQRRVLKKPFQMEDLELALATL